MDLLYSDYNDSVFYDDYSTHYDSEIFSEIEPAFHLFSTVCSILIFCISIPGNSFLLWALLRERAWKTTSHILLLQLTISDLCFTVTLPFIAYHFLHDWIFGDWVCRVVKGALFLGLNSYVLILTAMTLHRYVAVVRASCLSTPATKTLCLIMASIVIWLVCAAVSIKVSVNSEVTHWHGFIEKTCVHYSLFDPLLELYVQIGLFFLIPFIIITFCCVHMWVTIKQGRMNRHREPTRLILGLIVVFFLSLAPYNIIAFIMTLMAFGFLENAVLYRVKFIFETLLFLHCCLNPLIHIFGAQRFRRHLPMPCATSSQRRNRSQRLSSMAVIPPHDQTPL
ncbi:chemokine XC receptor 1-like [Sebastes umbrosus]|uniref:chemokine XC receptor 1-like n=1 Tax=Sebastes umbrosus TaxID=72105 RepID=UPI00189F1914|nr:chemokine XC receptor 1-like [Sebastes umbrosus]